MNTVILNRDSRLPEDGWYQIESRGEHVNHKAEVVQVIDDVAVAAMVSRFNAVAEATPGFPGMRVDNDHLSQSMDNPTEALGWCMRLRNRDGVSEAKIDWTALGLPLVESKPGRPPIYKFFSTEYEPAECQRLGIRIVNGKTYTLVRPLRIAGLSLTNDPNNKGQRPIANRMYQTFGLTPTLMNFGSGAQQLLTRRVGEFIAPTVTTTTAQGFFQLWSEKNRFRLPQTLRAAGGGATKLAMSADRQTFNCLPHGLDVPVDEAFGADVAALLEDGGEQAYDVAGLVHLVESLRLAKEAAGAGTDVAYDADADPVPLIDARIRALILVARSEGVGVLFGAGAWERFKNHPAVFRRCPGGPDYTRHPALFNARAEFTDCFAFHDATPEGIDEDIQFVLDNEILVFARNPRPNRRDTSFMKTFRLRGHEGTPTSWTRRDRRVTNAKIDWSMDIHVTNTIGVDRINYLHP